MTGRDERWVPEPEAARRGFVSERTIRQWLADGHLTQRRRDGAGRNLYWLPEVLEVEALRRARRTRTYQRRAR